MIRSVASGFVLLFLALALASPRAAHAAESYDNCTGFIASLPAVITTQGTWCLKQDLNTALTSGKAIEIQTNNVTLDCNDFKLGGLAAGLGTLTYGVYAKDRSNLTVRHCNIRGFFLGVYFGFTTSIANTGGHLVEDNRFDGNTGYGMIVKGDGSVVQRNRVSNTGAATAGTDATAIAGEGSVDIVNNIVSGVVATSGSNGWAYGINSQNSLGSSISGNRVRGLVPDGTGFEFGVAVQGTQIALRANDLVGSGIAGGRGLACPDATSGAKDNFINNFATAIDTCTNSGGNAVIP